MQNIRVQLLYTSNVHTAYVHTWKRYGMRARRVSISYKTRITLSKWTTIDTTTWVDSIYKTIKILTNCTDKLILCDVVE